MLTRCLRTQPIASFTLFLILKCVTREPYVKLDRDSAVLFATLESLMYIKPGKRPPSETKRRLSRFWNRKSERARLTADRQSVLNAAPSNQNIEVEERQGESV